MIRPEVDESKSPNQHDVRYQKEIPRQSQYSGKQNARRKADTARSEHPEYPQILGAGEHLTVVHDYAAAFTAPE